MNIKKILNFYLGLTLTLTLVSALSYNDSAKHYASVFSSGIFGAFGGIESGGSDSVLNASALNPPASPQNSGFYSQNKNSAVLNFEITNDPAKAFAKPGAVGVNIMNFTFKPQDSDFLLRNLTLKIGGGNLDSVLSAQLISGGKILDTASRNDEYLYFENIDYRLNAGDEGILNVVLDFNENAKAGDRLRLDIENPDDIEILAGGSPYKINGYYPMRGKYLSIVRTR